MRFQHVFRLRGLALSGPQSGAAPSPVPPLTAPAPAAARKRLLVHHGASSVPRARGAPARTPNHSFLRMSTCLDAFISAPASATRKAQLLQLIERKYQPGQELR